MGFIDFSQECYLASETLYSRWMTRGDVEKDDIAFTTEAPLGNVALIPDDRKYILSQRTVLLKIDPRQAVSRYVFQLMLSEQFQKILADNSSGTTAKGIQRKRFEQLKIICPNLPEQSAIAAALSDVDALLSALERLIAKKRDLKQAAMQQLLTGQTRLPGFYRSEREAFQKTDLGFIPSDWVLRQLGDLVDQSRSIRYGIVQPGKYDQNGRFMIRGQDYSKGWVEPSELFRVSAPIEERYKNARVATGDLIITIVGAGTGHVEAIPKWLDGANLTQTTARISIEANKADSVFVKYMLRAPVGTRQVSNYMKGAAQPGLNCGDINKFVVPLPPTLPEQTAIATVLTDMDAELTVLERRLAKTRALKQGMMQELLTGRTRLV